jgi:hypothetical protein
MLLCWGVSHDTTAVIGVELDDIRAQGDATPNCLANLLDSIDGFSASR